MKHTPIVLASAAMAAVLGLSACGSTGATTASGAASASATKAASAGSASAMVLPVSSNPIVNNSSNAVLVVSKAMAEDNTDPATGKPIADRLQLSLHNTGTQPLSGFEVYYTMTDAATKSVESYYQKLDGLQLPAGASTTIAFDNQHGVGHYPENQFSIYRSSTNQVDFAIEVSAQGAKIATAIAKKSKGTGEKVD